jgi:hypothetical protein
MFSLKHNCIVTVKFMGVQISEYEAVYVNMRRNSFAFVAMSVISVALMCSIIPSGSYKFVYAEEDESTQDNDSEENQHDGDESDNEEDGDNARSQDDDDGDDDDGDDDDGDDGDENDNSKTETEQETEQKNVCSGWAVCINVATNAEDSTGLATQTISETPMLLSLPL